MKAFVSIALALTFAALVPAAAAAELRAPESCCAAGGDGAEMMAMPCCAMPSCSMSPQDPPLRVPVQKGTQAESSLKVSSPDIAKTPPSKVASIVETGRGSFDSPSPDPSPPPTTSERLADLSTYLI